jgi:hypothetical protein
MTYNVTDICNRYAVREHTVLTWIHNGELKAVNVGVEPGKKKPRWRITQAALDAFEAMRSTTPPPPPTRRNRRKSKLAEVNYY